MWNSLDMWGDKENLNLEDFTNYWGDKVDSPKDCYGCSKLTGKSSV